MKHLDFMSRIMAWINKRTGRTQLGKLGWQYAPNKPMAGFCPVAGSNA